MQQYRSCKILLKRIFHFKEKVMPWNIKLLVDLWVEVQKFWMILNWKFSLLKWELPSSVLLKDLGVSAWGFFSISQLLRKMMVVLFWCFLTQTIGRIITWCDFRFYRRPAGIPWTRWDVKKVRKTIWAIDGCWWRWWCWWWLWLWLFWLTRSDLRTTL